jgi:hypothetical protein
VVLDDGFDVRAIRDLPHVALPFGAVDLGKLLPISFTKKLANSRLLSADYGPLGNGVLRKVNDRFRKLETFGAVPSAA